MIIFVTAKITYQKEKSHKILIIKINELNLSVTYSSLSPLQDKKVN